MAPKDIVCQGFGQLLSSDVIVSDAAAAAAAAAASKSASGGTDGAIDATASIATMKTFEYDADKTTVIIRPASQTDFWRKTYYTPILVKDDAPFLYHPLKVLKASAANVCSPSSYTIETHFTLSACSQFDQAGLYVRASSEHWIKTGIEVVDGVPRLSCVVTNGYSDWSTQPFHGGRATTTTATATASTTSGTTTSANDSHTDHGGRKEGCAGDTGVHVLMVPKCKIRIHCFYGVSFAVEAYNGNDKKWEFIRIAHLSVNAHTRPDPLAHVTEGIQSRQPNHSDVSLTNSDDSDTILLWAGIFAACPTRQVACEAKFTHFEIVKGSKFHHSTE